MMSLTNAALAMLLLVSSEKKKERERDMKLEEDFFIKFQSRTQLKVECFSFHEKGSFIAMGGKEITCISNNV